VSDSIRHKVEASNECEYYTFALWLDAFDQRHRLDGPAVEWSDGTKQWYINGKFHRLDGPAVEDDTGVKQWWVNDQNLTKEEFDKHPLVVFCRLCKGVV
jgi:hypothetical protein